MSYHVSLEQRDPQPAAVIRAEVARDGVPEFLEGAFGELYASLAGPPAGPPFARYRIVPDGFEVTAGVPVTSPMQPVGRVEPGKLPGGSIAVAMHTGSYEELPAAYDAVLAWVAGTGRNVDGEPWEAYLDGPEVAAPRTLVCFPVVDA